MQFPHANEQSRQDAGARESRQVRTVHAQEYGEDEHQWGQHTDEGRGLTLKETLDERTLRRLLEGELAVLNALEHLFKEIDLFARSGGVGISGGPREERSGTGRSATHAAAAMFLRILFEITVTFGEGILAHVALGLVLARRLGACAMTTILAFAAYTEDLLVILNTRLLN